jgi:hypothetical protein
MDSEPRTVSGDELKSMLQEAADGDVRAANHFFNRFRYVRELQENHNYSAALRQGMELLATCQALDAQAYEAVHKGTPFYWLGTAAFLSYDYQTAVFFFDAAVSEDLRAGSDPERRGSPALFFVQLDAKPQKQAARRLVESAHQLCHRLIQEYNQMPGAVSLTVDDVRKHFLRPAVSKGHQRWRSLATAFISFLLENGHRSTLLSLRHADGTAEPFFLHLLKGCVLFESLLKANPQGYKGNTLRDVLRSLSAELGIPSNIDLGARSLQTVIDDLPNARNTIEDAILFTGKLRNQLAHDLGWHVAPSPSEYHAFFRMGATSCLHAIACLYR